MRMSFAEPPTHPGTTRLVGMVSECFKNNILDSLFTGIEWYFKLQLRVPLSPKISLNGPMVLNDTEWYSNVISGIPLTFL